MSQDRYADLAGERDEAPPTTDDASADLSAAVDERTIYAGLCRGGPWDGVMAESRFPEGFLLVHMPSRQVWIYDRTQSGVFVARSELGRTLHDDGRDNRWRAADEGAYDIRVLAPEAVAV